MRPINLTEDAKVELFKKFFDKFKKELDNLSFSGDTTISVKTEFNEVAKEKIVIIYTPEAYTKMQSLVEFFDTEVAWYGLVDRIDQRTFRVYDVKVCKQYVNGAKVDTEDDDVLEFFDSLPDNEAAHMHFQAHSHVKMSTTASGVDLQNQQDVIKNMGKTGFYIFQIWNKNYDINTYLYDLDNNTFYDRKDVLIDIEGVDDFIASVADLVTEKKVYPYQWTAPKETKKEEESLRKDYWSGANYAGGYYERWDW